jgi:hypothetical protein
MKQGRLLVTGGTKGKQMTDYAQKVFYNTKDKDIQRHRIMVKLCCMMIAALLAAGFFQATAQAASGLKIYDYATKKESNYQDKQVKVTLNGKAVTDLIYLAFS